MYYYWIRFCKAMFTNKDEKRFGNNKKNRYINLKKIKLVILSLQQRRSNAYN